MLIKRLFLIQTSPLLTAWLRLTAIFLIIISFLPAKSQMFLDSSNFPVPGLNLHRFYCGTWHPDTINYVYTGDAQNFDFSFYQIFFDDTLEFLDATATPFTNEHPGADVATFRPVDSVSYIYNFFSYDNNAYCESGVTYVVDIGNDGILDTLHGSHSDVDTLISSDYTFGHQETETSLVTVYINPLAYADFHKVKEIQVDGWGTLNTPFAFYDEALRIKYIEYRYDSIFVMGNLDNATSDTLYYYLFFAKDVQYPVVIAHFNETWELQYVEIMKKIIPIYGCTDPEAINYNPLATADDGSCIYCDPISYTITPDTWICIGESINLQVTGGNSYLWSTYETTSVITVQPVSNTVYSVYVFDIYDCQELATVEVSVYDTVEAGFWVNTNNLQLSDSVLFVNTSVNAANYFWDFDDPVNGTSTEKDPKHLYSSAGTKNVMLIAYNLCFSDTFYYSIVILSVEELAETISDIKVYPNPGENPTIEFTLAQNANIDITISDLSGRNFHILKEACNSGKFKYSVNSYNLNLEAGIYIISITVDGKTYRQKWIKI